MGLNLPALHWTSEPVGKYDGGLVEDCLSYLQVCADRYEDALLECFSTIRRKGRDESVLNPVMDELEFRQRNLSYARQNYFDAVKRRFDRLINIHGIAPFMSGYPASYWKADAE